MCYTWVRKLTGKSESEDLNDMNISLIDEYVYLVLLDNGWTEKGDFLLADGWIEKIEQESSISCFEYARKTLHLFGGMKFREFSPKSGQYLLGKCNGDVNHLENMLFIYERKPKRLMKDNHLRLSDKSKVVIMKGKVIFYGRNY